jgi:hypothetical protein
MVSCVFTSGLKPKSTPTSEPPTVTVPPEVTDTPVEVATETQEVAPTQEQPTEPPAASKTSTSTPPSKSPPAPATKTPTLVALPGAKLNGSAPWLLFSASSGLWAANSDGSALTQLIKEPIVGPDNLQSAVSPDGKLVAYISGDQDRTHNLKLNLMTLPDGRSKTITALTSKSTEPDPGTTGLTDKIEAVRAITEVDSLAWSPDGQTLAFIGVQSGPTADLYSYTLKTGKFAHLSDGPAQAYGPHWSPDGKSIVNFGVTTFGTGGGYTMAGGWATTPDGSETITIFQPGGSGQEFGGWVNNHSFLINAWTMACGPQDLRIYDLTTKKETSLIKGCITGKAVADNNHVILVTGNGYNNSLNGVVSFGPGNTNRKELYKDPADSVVFLKQDGGFLVRFDKTQAIYTNSGEMLDQAPDINCTYKTSLAAFGALYAWACSKGEVGLWVNGPGVPAMKVFDQAALMPAWNGKNTLFFFNNSTLYSALFPDYKPEPAGQITGDILGLAWAGTP